MSNPFPSADSKIKDIRESNDKIFFDVVSNCVKAINNWKSGSLNVQVSFPDEISNRVNLIITQLTEAGYNADIKHIIDDDPRGMSYSRTVIHIMKSLD